MGLEALMPGHLPSVVVKDKVYFPSPQWQVKVPGKIEVVAAMGMEEGEVDEGDTVIMLNDTGPKAHVVWLNPRGKAPGVGMHTAEIDYSRLRVTHPIKISLRRSSETVNLEFERAHVGPGQWEVMMHACGFDTLSGKGYVPFSDLYGL